MSEAVKPQVVPESQAPVAVPLQRAPLWSSGLTVLTTLTVAYALSTATSLVQSGASLDAEAFNFGGMVLLLVTLMAGVVGKRWLVRRRPLQPVRFFPDHMLLPRHAEAWNSKPLAYSEILAVHEGGRAPKRHFFIESQRHVFHLTQDMFCDDNGPERLFKELRQRLLDLPEGTALLQQTEHKRLEAVRAMAQRPIWTQAILGVMLVFFLNTYLKGAQDSPFGLVRWGANVPALVRAGELYRLVAASFLHGGWLSGLVHISMNGMALYYLGNLLERLMGWPRFVLLFTLTGLAAMGASALLNDAIMILGASGAVFGLLGAFALLSWRLRSHLPLGLRQPLRWWIFMLAANTLVPLLWPMVDITAQAVGFVCGGLLCALLLGRQKKLPGAAGPLLSTLSLVMVGVYVAGLGIAVWQASRAGPDSDLRFVETVVQSPHTSVASLNALAMIMAVSPESTDEALQVADRAVDMVLTQEPDNPLFFNTAAMLRARQKNLEGAITAERRALTLVGEDHPVFASQLARFLGLRMRASGPLLRNGLQAQAFGLQVDAKSGELVLDRAPTAASNVFALLRRSDQTLGLVQLRTGDHPTLPARFTTPLVRAAAAEEWQLELVLAENSHEPPSAGSAQWVVVPVLELTY